MAFRYVIRKRKIGIGSAKADKYVAASFSVADVDFNQLCDQVTSQGLMPRGIVKSVLDGLIDALCTYTSIGATVRLADFGSIRPGLNGAFISKCSQCFFRCIEELLLSNIVLRFNPLPLEHSPNCFSNIQMWRVRWQ